MHSGFQEVPPSWKRTGLPPPTCSAAGSPSANRYIRSHVDKPVSPDWRSGPTNEEEGVNQLLVVPGPERVKVVRAHCQNCLSSFVAFGGYEGVRITQRQETGAVPETLTTGRVVSGRGSLSLPAPSSASSIDFECLI